MDLLNGKCNFTNSRGELLPSSNRSNPTHFPACGYVQKGFLAGKTQPKKLVHD